jgi:hypothetical protein
MKHPPIVLLDQATEILLTLDPGLPLLDYAVG